MKGLRHLVARIAEVIVVTGAKTTAIVLGVVAVGVGFLTLIMGSPPTEHRDADGYYMDEPFRFERPSRAIVTDDIDILKGVYTELADDAFVLYVTADPVHFRMQALAGAPAPLFMGVAATTAVDDYLMDIAYDEVAALERDEESKQILDVQYVAHDGPGTPGPPGTEAIWLTSAEGTGLQTLDWTLEPGDWTAVIMNADASTGVSVDLAFGAAPGSNVDSIGRTATTVAVIALIGGLALLTYALLRRNEDRSVKHS